MSSGSTSTTSLYKAVIDDVVQNEFINAGVDESILQDLKALWIRKLVQSKCLSHENEGFGQDQQGGPVEVTDDDDYSDFPFINLPPTNNNGTAVNNIMPPSINGNAQGNNSANISPGSNRILQLDGDDSGATNNNNTNDDNENDQAADSSPQQLDEEELGSDLDEEEEQEEDTSNRLLCQFEKVTRSRNRWKCILKDGIATINGRDYVFSKAQGDFEF